MRHYWAVEWLSHNKLDGTRRYWMSRAYQDPADRVYTGCHFALFNTRREARAWIKRHYGYIANRPDLLNEPHGWTVPKVHKVKIELTKL